MSTPSRTPSRTEPMPERHAQPQLALYVITGSSRGIGLALAEQLLSAQHQLLCMARSANDHLAAQARQAGCLLEQWHVNLEHGAQAAQQLQQYLAQQDPARYSSACLINNAALIPPVQPLRSAKPHDLAQALRVGLEAPMQLCAAFLAGTAAWAVPRKILNISSGLGRRAMASQSAYCAAKAGMDHFTRCLALDEALDPHGARVCSLAPGVVDTDMQTQLRTADAQAFPDREGFARLKAQGQLATPAQAARRILAYLAHAEFGAQPVADVRDLPPD